MFTWAWVIHRDPRDPRACGHALYSRRRSSPRRFPTPPLPTPNGPSDCATKIVGPPTVAFAVKALLREPTANIFKTRRGVEHASIFPTGLVSCFARDLPDHTYFYQVGTKYPACLCLPFSFKKANPSSGCPLPAATRLFLHSFWPAFVPIVPSFGSAAAHRQQCRHTSNKTPPRGRGSRSRSRPYRAGPVCEPPGLSPPPSTPPRPRPSTRSPTST